MTYMITSSKETVGSLWKNLVHYVNRLYKDLCSTVDLQSFTRILEDSLKKLWLQDMLHKTVDFPSVPSMAGMENTGIKLLCKYNATTYENAFQMINRLIIKKYSSKFVLDKRGADKAMLIDARILQHYFEQAKQSVGSDEFYFRSEYAIAPSY